MTGVVLYELGRREEAIKDYTKAIDIDPQDSDAYYNRGLNYLIIFVGNALLGLGRNEDAI